MENGKIMRDLSQAQKGNSYLCLENLFLPTEAHDVAQREYNCCGNPDRPDEAGRFPGEQLVLFSHSAPPPTD